MAAAPLLKQLKKVKETIDPTPLDKSPTCEDLNGLVEETSPPPTPQRSKGKSRRLPAPGHRRPDPNCSTWDYAMQAVAAFFLFSMWSLVPVFSVVFPIWCIFFTNYWYLMLPYTIWYIYDFNTPVQGSRHLPWAREWSLWRHLAEYYPVGLVKTVDLPPDKNYILGSHPHGFWCTGVFCHLLTDGTNFRDEFPGFIPSLLTLNGQFWFPFRRDVGVSIGGVMSSRESLDYLLRTKSAGRMIGIVIGGSRELLEAHVGRHFTFLKTRRGFVRYALKYGQAFLTWHGLFPRTRSARTITSFNSPTSRARCCGEFRRVFSAFSRAIDPLLQDKIKEYCGFCPPIYRGRGLINPWIGLLPFRRPITMVVGAPIPVERRPEPTDEEIEELHAKYVKALVALFEEHKANFGVPPHKHLIIG
ncbi:Acyltransferase [Aphelenchoides fujianensis]|nr:Acyltransferase [Aphelenchoides fujianensis]